jgi:hypothetical protein
VTGKPSKRDRLIAALTDPKPPWELNPYATMTVHGCAARFRRTVTTPAYAREKRRYKLPPLWDEPTYVQQVGVTLVAAAAKPLVRVIACPWAEVRTWQVTLERALAIIADPVSQLPELTDGQEVITDEP